MNNERLQIFLARVIGIVLTLTGILGFAGNGMVLIFGVNVLHNLIHLTTGALGLIAGFGFGGDWARFHNRWLGVVYLVVAVVGVLAPDLVRSLLAINGPDNLLHFALGIVLVGVGFSGQPKQVSSAA